MLVLLPSSRDGPRSSILCSSSSFQPPTTSVQSSLEKSGIGFDRCSAVGLHSLCHQPLVVALPCSAPTSH